MKHAKAPAPGPDELTERRLALLEEQLTELSRAHVRLGAESRVQAAIIRRRNAQISHLALLLRRLLLAYGAPARARRANRPAVLDSGTPGVEVTPR